MILFGIGNLLLKVNRSRLPRPERSSWLGLFIGVIAVAVAIVGNVILNPQYLAIFIEYLIPTLAVVYFMLYRTSIFRVFLKILDYVFPEKNAIFVRLNKSIKKALNTINRQQFVYFTNHDDVSILNKVLLYISENESTKRIKIV
ncbi:MAG TPA: amino acid permease, partial [Maribacter sp.]|nr:amino acid permease [Maribacter sp.]